MTANARSIDPFTTCAYCGRHRFHAFRCPEAEDFQDTVAAVSRIRVGAFRTVDTIYGTVRFVKTEKGWVEVEVVDPTGPGPFDDEHMAENGLNPEDSAATNWMLDNEHDGVYDGTDSTR